MSASSHPHVPSEYDRLYKYYPLDPLNSEIRLLEIVSSPIVSRNYLRVRFSVVSLDQNPEESALSYMWGTSGETEEIIVDLPDGTTATISITKSLAQALKYIK